ncbi:4-amino-4-deoxy-L-arabinose transferase-like glycosyltransferase [Inhella inkyongensis]|uniref:4-amino-4-deoxy-L-arabinose transferase-like glycosyltransferase n=1 Tax=Inhella inkyongensis TaxID=392593 RepID=A0A840S9A4_9BURK|nr:hypothetical protein [Inhella inkyongensis]MBB5206223.1 4-amino-4-deoxy-L-arabinose transferase-like glycosyltransferase [Inhella inkyongensis]
MLKTRAFWIVLALLVGLPLLYFWAALSWSYSEGERAGWVQKFSKKGWICKTWEGELALVSMPGAAPEKFEFSVHDEAVAARITEAMGRRVALHYEQKKGLPGSCFGDTRYFITDVKVADQIPLAPGVAVPQPAPQPAPVPASAP